jgi:hypothetical protein
VSSGWAASPAAIDSGESRSRHGLYTFPSTGGGFIQMTIVSNSTSTSTGQMGPAYRSWMTSQASHTYEQSRTLPEDKEETSRLTATARLTMLDFSIFEIILEYPTSTPLINQQRPRRRISRCPRTSRPINPRENSIIIHLVPQYREIIC